MPAKDTLLGKLHEKLAEKYLAQLEQLDPEDITPALLTSISNFLKQNGITAEIGDEELDELAKKAKKAANVVDFPFDPAKEASQ